MQTKNFIILIIFVLIITMVFSACDIINPSNNAKITLTAEDASCTEVWLNLRLNNISLPAKIFIKESDSTLVTANVNNSDTTLIVENLLPNKAYTFKAKIEKEKLISQAQITTMDTTSHNFTWETFTFGGGGSSILRDVTIINENNIWAVGEIHTADTDKFDQDSNWVQPYNAVHWNGQKWELKRIIVNYCGNPIFLSLESIFAFSATDIWLVSSLPIHGDGKNWQIYDVREETNSNLSLTNVWGSSSNDIYFVGRSGSLAHYNGSSWTKIESGTDVDLLDIWGSPNGEKIWVCGNDDFKPTVLLTIKNNKADILYSSEKNLFSYGFYRLSGSFMSLWSDNKNILHILTGYDLYKIYKDDVNTPIPLWKKRNEQIATRKVRGTKGNNIFIVGEIGELCHYNGVSWKTYSELAKKLKEYKSISVNKNMAVAVGQDYINGIEDKAIISITKK